MFPLRDHLPQRPAVVALLGCIAATGFAGPAAAQFLGTNVRAGPCSVAVGESVTSSTVQVLCGLSYGQVMRLLEARTRPLEELTTLQKQAISRLTDQLGMTERQMRGALEIIGEASTPPERVGDRLLEIARHFAELRSIGLQHSGDDVSITAMRGAAAAALQDGNLEAMDRALGQIELTQRAMAARLNLSLSETVAQRGRILLAQRNFAEAVKRYDDAIRHIADSPASETLAKYRGFRLIASLGALAYGSAHNDDNALRELAEQAGAIIASRGLYDVYTVQSIRGIALHELAQRQSSLADRIAVLEQAVASLRASRQGRRDLETASIFLFDDDALANALHDLGLASVNVSLLEESAEIYRSLRNKGSRINRRHFEIVLVSLAAKRNYDRSLLEEAFRLRSGDQGAVSAPEQSLEFAGFLITAGYRHKDAVLEDHAAAELRTVSASATDDSVRQLVKSKLAEALLAKTAIVGSGEMLPEASALLAEIGRPSPPDLARAVAEAGYRVGDAALLNAGVEDLLSYWMAASGPKIQPTEQLSADTLGALVWSVHLGNASQIANALEVAGRALPAEPRSYRLRRLEASLYAHIGRITNDAPSFGIAIARMQGLLADYHKANRLPEFHEAAASLALMQADLAALEARGSSPK